MGIKMFHFVAMKVLYGLCSEFSPIILSDVDNNHFHQDKSFAGQVILEHMTKYPSIILIKMHLQRLKALSSQNNLWNGFYIHMYFESK